MNINWIWFLCHYFLLIFCTHKYKPIFVPQDGVRMKNSIWSRLCLSATSFGWRGLVKYVFQNKGLKTFLRIPSKGFPLMLHPELEDPNTQVMYESDWDKFKLQFSSNTVIGCNVFNALVLMDPYNSLEADMHNDIVGSVGALMLVINVLREDHY